MNTDAEWLAEQFDALTDSVEILQPSEWAEKNRYLPQQVTPMPGFYSFKTFPYLREILDCLSIQSPIREISVKKGSQIGATVGILENAMGYFIAHVRTAPMMWVTSDNELAKIRLESYVIPMLNYSGLRHLIKSSDEANNRRTGQTDKKLEWEGGGFLLPLGAKNPDKIGRSTSIRILLRDEIDSFPDNVGKQGDPLALSFKRTDSYETSRKILDLSTPLIKGMSKITRQYERGDQRQYFVVCKYCEYPQPLWFKPMQAPGSTSERFPKGKGGLVWETESGLLVPGSVRYLCRECGGEHINDDKAVMMDPDNGAQWVPTAKPVAPDVRSYNLPSFYSPPGFQSWESCVKQWLECWDEEKNRVRDVGLLQVYYNNVMAEPFEIRGERLKFVTVSAHRRREYHLGEIPNKHAEEFSGAPVLFLLCTVDVQKNNLAVAVWGCCLGRRKYLVDYWRFEGETEKLDDPATWGRLRELIGAEYRADDGREYGIALTFVDSGYQHDTVLGFCAEYEAGVCAIRGVDSPRRNAAIKEFSEFETKLGTFGFNITVDLYKDRWYVALRRAWDGVSMQPEPFFNAPVDTADKQLKELTVETKREKREATTGRMVGYEWHRPEGADNELWDLLIYSDAACDVIAWHVCRNELGLETVNWPAFYDLLISRIPAKVGK